MTKDAEKIIQKLPEAVGPELAALPRILYGRSLGAVSAVHLAALPNASATIRGLIVESGLVDIKGLPMVQQMLNMMMGHQASGMLALLPEPVGSLKKATKINVPVLIIHGTNDEIIPYQHAQKLLDGCTTAPSRHLETVQNGGHNDIPYILGSSAYTGLLSKFIAKSIGSDPDTPAEDSKPLTVEGVDSLSVKELKAELSSRGIDYSGCFERSELVSLLKESI